jgi:hypothetical protein
MYEAIVANPDLWHEISCGCLGIGPWIGLRRVQGVWTWVSGEVLAFSAWHPGEPWEPTPRDFVRYFHYVAPLQPAPLWDNGPSGDEPEHESDGTRSSYVIEWSADCNSNGIVDYGEIRNGFVEDTNGNNIPDACECAADPSLPLCCPADVIEDSAVNAIDLAAILNTWGTDGGKFPRADVDGSGVVDGADLAAVLSEWGPCGK